MEIRQWLKQEAVVETARKKQRAWKVKVEDMEEERLVKCVHNEDAIGQRPRRRPRKLK